MLRFDLKCISTFCDPYVSQSVRAPPHNFNTLPNIMKILQTLTKLLECSYFDNLHTLPEYQGSDPMICWEGNQKYGGLGSDYYRSTMADRPARSVTCNLPHHSTPTTRLLVNNYSNSTRLFKSLDTTQQKITWNSVER